MFSEFKFVQKHFLLLLCHWYANCKQIALIWLETPSG